MDFKNHIANICEITGKGKPGFVYLMKCGDLYKIGRSGNVKKRLQSLNTNSPQKIDIVTYRETENMVSFERMMHSMFSPWRVRGEWFKLDEKTLQIALDQY